MTIQKDTDHNEIKFLSKYMDVKDKCVLEIGCGEGRLTWQYAAVSSLTVGLDLDRDALRLATVDRPSNLDDKVYFSHAKVEWLPFRKETFDIVLLAWSF